MTLSAALGCGGGPADQPEPLEGRALVGGTSLDRHGLLVLPQAGGVAEFRSIEDPSTVRWTGRLELPAISAAHSIGAAAVVRHEGGAAVYTVQPENLAVLPDVPAHARWHRSPGGGAFVAGGWALAVTASGSRAVTAEGEIVWAAPSPGGRVVGLIEAAGAARLAVWEAEDETPSHTRPAGRAGPAALTGWGEEIATTSEDGSRLIEYSVPELEPSGGFELDAPPTALAASPSQHRMFVASASRARLVAVDRYEWRRVWSRAVDAPIEALRPSVMGGRVIAYDGSSAWSLPTGGGEPRPVPGSWRADLPLALPDGATLSATTAGLRVSRADGTVGEVDGPIDAWWLPFRWGPRAPVTAVAVATEDTIEDAPPTSSDRGIGLLTMGTVEGRAVALPPTPGARRAAEPPPAEGPVGRGAVGAGPPGGFYAVANSSRQLASLGQLRSSLEGSGYTTQVLLRVDEANDTWYRLLVGPYPTRPAAEAVARELRRERGIDAWIHEVAGDPGDGGGS